MRLANGHAKVFVLSECPEWKPNVQKPGLTYCKMVFTSFYYLIIIIIIIINLTSTYKQTNEQTKS